MVSLISKAIIERTHLFCAQRELCRLESLYQKKQTLAEQQGDFEWLEDLKIDESMEPRDVWEICQRHKCRKLLARAKRLGISLADVPKPPGEWTHWDQDPESLPGILHWHSYRTLSAMVEKVKEERVTQRRAALKTYAPYAAILVALAGTFLNVFIKH